MIPYIIVLIFLIFNYIKSQFLPNPTVLLSFRLHLSCFLPTLWNARHRQPDRQTETDGQVMVLSPAARGPVGPYPWCVGLRARGPVSSWALAGGVRACGPVGPWARQMVVSRPPSGAL